MEALFIIIGIIIGSLIIIRHWRAVLITLGVIALGYVLLPKPRPFPEGVNPQELMAPLSGKVPEILPAPVRHVCTKHERIGDGERCIAWERAK